MKKFVFTIGLFLTVFSVVAEDNAGILDNPEGKKELRATDVVPAIVCNNQRISVFDNRESATIYITVYDSEGFVVYRGARCVMSEGDDFLLLNLDPTEYYTVIATIDGETYMMDMIP